MIYVAHVSIKQTDPETGEILMDGDSPALIYEKSIISAINYANGLDILGNKYRDKLVCINRFELVGEGKNNNIFVLTDENKNKLTEYSYSTS